MTQGGWHGLSLPALVATFEEINEESGDAETFETLCTYQFVACFVEKEHLSRMYVLFVTIIYSLVYYYLVFSC